MMRRRSTIVLFVSAIIACSSGDAAAQHAAPRLADPDPWVGQDKAMHLCAAATLAGGGYALGALATDGLPGRLALGAALALSAGGAKEALDAGGLGTPSLRDLLWNVVGTAFGVALAASIDVAARPASFGPRTASAAPRLAPRR
jgi:putative lipoprotein